MPEHNDLLKLVNHYFDQSYYEFGGKRIAINYRISELFKVLEFTNPRRVKKVLNKYQMFRSFSAMSNRNEIPNIDMKDGKARSLFETILVIYLIILHEFYNEEFNDFLNFEKKKDIYTKVLKNNSNAIPTLNEILLTNYSQRAFGSILNDTKARPSDKASFEQSFFICLSPLKIQGLTLTALTSKNASQIIVNERHIDFLFYKFINDNDIQTLLENSTGNMTFTIAKSLVKNLL